MWPEWALAGTVTISPALPWCRCAAGETRLTRAPGDLGKATTIPLVRPGPCSSRVPWMDTWWGLALHLAVGVQLTRVMRTVLTCSEETTVVLLGAAGALEPGAPVPPALAARQAPAPPRANAKSEMDTAARWMMRLWAAALAKITKPLLPPRPTVVEGCFPARSAESDVTGSALANVGAPEKLR